METQVDTGTERPSGRICYVWGIIYPLVYLASVPRDRQQPFLRFHCVQCLLLFAFLGPLAYLGPFASGNTKLSNIASIAFLILTVGWLVAMIQAGRGKKFKLPVLGNIAERLATRVQSSSE
jgi:uncharacterized membrane protein